MTSRIANSKLAETSLYAPAKGFLEGQGFEAKGEICGCDIVAVRPGEPPIVVIIELKLSFTLALVLQAVDRMRAADHVYLAITRVGGAATRMRACIACAVYLASACCLSTPGTTQ